MAQRFGFEIDPRKKVANMAVSEKQTLEIIKVLYYGAKVIILDEPTAVLTVQEIDKLFSVLRRMKEDGHSIIIITHKLNEVMDISDRVAILRKGEYITTVNTAETNEQALTEWMVGREIKAGPNVIVTAYPVRGLDINSSYAIYNILNQQKKDGVGILFVGEDLDVMLALCDKIMVLCHGKVMGVVHAHKTSKEELGLMMTGALDLTYKYEDKPAGIARDTNISAQELQELEQQESGSQEGED